VEVGVGGVEADATAGMCLDPGQEIVERRALGQAAQLAGHVLLERLARPLGAALELGVDLVGNVTDE
jgi:hypothetical protein